MIYLACYRGNSSSSLVDRLQDSLIRKITRGIYSHCEIAIERDDGQYDCYTSSPRDGGVRLKTMRLPDDKWNLIPIDISAETVQQFYQHTQGKAYDYLGALGMVFGLPENPRRYFCSEWCATVLGYQQGWRFSPNDLAVILTRTI